MNVPPLEEVEEVADWLADFFEVNRKPQAAAQCRLRNSHYMGIALVMLVFHRSQSNV